VRRFLLEDLPRHGPRDSRVCELLYIREPSSGGGGGGITSLTGQVITTGPGPAAPTKVVGSQVNLYVAPSGNDANVGNSFNPFLTIAKANTVAATLATLAVPVAIVLFPGTYTENVALLPSVIIVGSTQDDAIAQINGNVSLDASWAGAGAGFPLTALESVIVLGTTTIDWSAVTAATGSAGFFDVDFEGAFVETGWVGAGSGNNGSVFQGCNGLDATFTHTGVFGESYSSRFGSTDLVSTAALQSQRLSWGDTFSTGTGATANVTLDASAGSTAVLGLANTLITGTLTLNGPLATVTSDVGSNATYVFAGGATSAQVTSSGSMSFGTNFSTLGKLNFQGNAASSFLAYKDTGGTDRALLRTDGAGDLFYGSSGPGDINFFQGGFSVIVEQPAAANSLEITGASATLNSTLFQVNSTPTRFDATSTVSIAAYALFISIVPPASPPDAILYSIGDDIGTGHGLSSTSDQGMICGLTPAGSSSRDFIFRSAQEKLAIAGGGSANVSLPIPSETCCKILVTCVGVGNTGSDGFSEEATATVRCDAGGVAAFVTATAANSNPDINPALDHASDASFNSAGGAPSFITLVVAGGDLVVTVNNANAGNNDFLVFFEVKGFAT
jgi:hypothetical protein